MLHIWISVQLEVTNALDIMCSCALFFFLVVKYVRLVKITESITRVLHLYYCLNEFQDRLLMLPQLECLIQTWLIHDYDCNLSVL